MPVAFLFAAALPQVPPPMIATPASPTQVLVDLTPETVTCGDGAPKAVALVKPIPFATSVGPGQVVPPWTASFRIDESGRPLGITVAPRETRGLYMNPSDLQPALAASRSAAGAPYTGCTIRYVAAVRPVADAPIDLVYRYLALPHDRAYFESAIEARARAAGAGCFDGGAPKVLLRGYPDYDAVPQPPGGLTMTMVGFDIDAKGKPVRVRTLTSDGNAALDAAGRAAVARSRFGKDARTGCSFPYYRRQAVPLAPPPRTPIDQYRQPGGCGDAEGTWALPPRMTFPEPFRRRAIEGWAVVRYDVAPWGQTGNVVVLASEPAAMFGDQARQIVSSARRPASERGASGCVERVVFKLPEGGSGDGGPPPPPPPIID